MAIFESQLLQKDKEINRLNDLLDHNQQLLLSEQKKSQLLIENTNQNKVSNQEWETKIQELKE